MESQFWSVLDAHPFFVLIIVIGGLIALATIINARTKIHDALGYKTRYELDRDEYEKDKVKRDKRAEDLWKEIKDMREENRLNFKELSTDLKNVKNANIMVLGDRISQKSTHYLSQGSIPADEMLEFQGMYDTYKAIGGNHGVDKIFEKTVAALPLSSPTDKEE